MPIVSKYGSKASQNVVMHLMAWVNRGQLSLKLVNFRTSPMSAAGDVHVEYCALSRWARHCKKLSRAFVKESLALEPWPACSVVR